MIESLSLITGEADFYGTRESKTFLKFGRQLPRSLSFLTLPAHASSP